MTEERKDMRIEFKLRNNLVLTAMERRGIATIAELCRQMGCPNRQTGVGALVAMKMSARKKDGEWRTAVHLLSKFFQCMPEDLFSEPQQFNSLERNRAYAELAFVELQQLTLRRQEPATPELTMQANELRKALEKALSKLIPREERVLRMHFGFDTGEEMAQAEIAESFGLSPARMGKILAKALQKLKHPSRSNPIIRAGCKKVKRGRVVFELDEEIVSSL